MGATISAPAPVIWRREPPDAPGDWLVMAPKALGAFDVIRHPPPDVDEASAWRGRVYADAWWARLEVLP